MNWFALMQSSLILFAIVNPVGSIPIFLQLTHNMNPQERRRAFQTGILTSAVILFIFVFVGEGLLTRVFQIQLSDLMAAGGLLLLIIAIDHLMFGALVRGVMTGETQDPQHIGAVPMACPILAGPGAMMTVFITQSQYGFFVAMSSILVVLGITGLVLFFIDKVYGFFGKIVCLVLSKILCLFIAAIGIRLLLQGLAHYFK